MLRTLKMLVFFGLLPGFASTSNAQSPLVQLAWYPDLTVPFPALQYSAGGKVGGTIGYNITLPPDPANGYYRATHMRLIDKSGFFPIIDADDFDGYLMWYGVKVPNGNYTFTVSFALCTTDSASGNFVITPLPDQSVDFTVADPCVTATSPASPTPLLWKETALLGQDGSASGGSGGGSVTLTGPITSSASSANNNSDPVNNLAAPLPPSVPITVTVDGGCYSCNATVDVYVYNPNDYGAMFWFDGDFATLEKQVVLKPGKNLIAFNWDGNFPSGGARSGAYTFDTTVRFYNQIQFPYWIQSSPESNYEYTAPASGLYDFGMDVNKVSNDGTNTVYSLQYLIVPCDNIERGDSPYPFDFLSRDIYDGSGGQIDVYDGVTKIMTQKLAPSDVTAWRFGSFHSVNITVPSVTDQPLTFILSPLDNFAPVNDDHKPHYLSRCAYREFKPTEVAWANGEFPNLAGSFYDKLHDMGYERVPHNDGWYGDPTVTQTRDPLQAKDTPPSVAFMGGHGDIAGTVLSLSKTSYVVTQAAYNLNNKATHPDLKTVNCLILETLANQNGSPNRPLTYMDLMVLDSCDMQEGINTKGIPDVLLNLGVSCVVVIGQHEMPSGTVSLWLNDPDSGFIRNLADGKSIKDAAQAADTYVNSILSVTDDTLEGHRAPSQLPHKLDTDRIHTLLDDAHLPVPEPMQSRVLGNGRSTIAIK